ncbi:MAG: radical SAM protein [Candidatus Omnitrophota bacterium]|jgi:MoaA/NifB/PqqE/SkfB family radical SAM enzyme
MLSEKNINIKKFPSVIGIETTAFCNAVCLFCPLHGKDGDLRRPKGVMTKDLFEKIVAELFAHRDEVDTIFLNVCGEPFLDPHFSFRLETLHKYKLASKLDIQTNGQFLQESFCRDIINNSVKRITLGFDGASKEIYEEHRKNCNYEKVLSNIDTFIKMRAERNSKIQLIIKYVLTNKNSAEVEQAYQMWAKILNPWLDRFVICPSENWSNSRLNTDTQIKKKTVNKVLSYKFCSQLVRSISIFHDGKVPACCWDYNLIIAKGGMGDVNTNTMEEIWENEKFEKLRMLHRQKDFSKLPHCKICSNIIRFPDAFQVSGIRWKWRLFDPLSRHFYSFLRKT